jgi:hypothetical protein
VSGKKFLWGDFAIEESVEVRIDNDFLFPVLHRLLVFINVHSDILNI